jgi:hypothetical protein
MKRYVQLRARAVVLAVAALGIVAIVSTATAGPAGVVKTFTGCLATGDGVIVKIKEGDSPKSACSGGQTLARLSGGDITKISVTGGLTLTDEGESGDVEINLDSKYSLPQNCTDGQVAKWNDTAEAWECRDDEDTKYHEGTGLALDEARHEFSIRSAYRIPGKACSASGEFARGFDSNGVIQCAAPTSAGVEVWQKTAGSMALPKGEGVDVIAMPLQPGSYLITAVATIRDGGGDFRDEEVSVECLLRNGVFATLPVQESQVDIGEELGRDGPAGTAVVHGVITFASADSVRFTCTSSEGDDEPDQAFAATITAMKVGAVHTP